MYCTKKKAYTVFILFVYLTGCQRSNLYEKQEKIVENVIAEKKSISNDIMKVSQINDFILLEEFKVAPLEEDEGLKLEVEYSEIENTPDTFKIYTTKGQEFFRFRETSYNQFDKLIKYIWYENDLPKGIVFPYIDPSSIDSFGVYHRNGLCIIDGKNGKIKLFSVVSFSLFEIDNIASYLCIGVLVGRVPTVVIYNIETVEELKRVAYEPYRDRAMFTKKIKYENDSFIVRIGADTVEFVEIKIPIDAENDYQVINTFSFGDKETHG